MAGHRRILLVEDHTDIRVILAMYLHMAGHFVIGVATGHDALAAVANGTFDLVVTDIGLPDMDGIALLHQLTSGRTIECVTMSAYPFETDPSAVVGCRAHLVKPFNPSDLVNLIDTLPAVEQAPSYRSHFQSKKTADPGSWTPNFIDDD